MTPTQKFILAQQANGYFLTQETLEQLIQLDRLAQVLVRCGGCRFTTPAQNVEHLVKCVAAGGDYVRDISFTAKDVDAARSAHAAENAWSLNRPVSPTARRVPVRFDENDCSGAFDGNQVTSDADPGL